MNKSTKKISMNTFSLVSFIFLSSLLVSENVFSQDSWNRSYAEAMRDSDENSIIIKFVVFNYYFRVNDKEQAHAYLELCDFSYSTKDKNFVRLMRVITKDQHESNFTEFDMTFKKKNSDLQFLGCFRPTDASMWLDADKRKKSVAVNNQYKGDPKKPIAIFTVKWLLGEKYKKVKYIRLFGHWAAKGLPSSLIDTFYDVSNQKLKSTVNQSENNQVNVAAKADEIVITGAENGKNIRVYNLSGVEVQSTITNCDFVNIKLPKNQIYIVNIGHVHYKVAL